MKKSKKAARNAHTADTKYGMGDFYGSGIRAKTGKMRGMFWVNANPVKPRGLKKPPKTLA